MTHKVVNEITGLISCPLHDQEYSLRYPWSALAVLRAEFGENYDKEIMKAMATQDLTALAKIASAGIITYHPEMTADFIFAMSPPIGPLLDALNDALNLAYHGPEFLKNEPEPTPQTAQKKSRKTPFWSRIGRRSKPVLRPMSSGS